jgi:hypothetical protein
MKCSPKANVKRQLRCHEVFAFGEHEEMSGNVDCIDS